MATNAELAYAILDEYVKLRQSTDQVFITYGELASLIGRPGQHALLGGPLDLVRDICRGLSIPDIATMVINQESMKSGKLLPSGAALDKYGGWPGLRKEQARVLAFDWNTYRR